MRHIKRALRDRRGSAAVEMALLAPVLIAALLAMADLGMLIYERVDMQTAIRAGIQYVMNGGHDPNTAEQVVLQSWPNRPGDAVVEATRFCLCGETVSACDAQCSDQSVPRVFTRITASGTLGMFLFSEPVVSDEVARVR